MKPATPKERTRQAWNAARERAAGAYSYGNEERESETAHGGRCVQVSDGETITTTVQLASGRLVELSREVGTENGAGKVNRDVRLAPPLGKYAQSVTPDAKRGRVLGSSPHDRSATYIAPQLDWAPKPTRRRLYWIRARARQLTAQHPGLGPVQYLQDRRQRACGVCRHGAEGISVAVSEGGSARFLGVQHCGSVWLCPTCRLLITAGRAAEVSAVVEGHGIQRTYMLTLTVRHALAHLLKPLRRGVGESYRGLTRGAPWARLKERIGLNSSVDSNGGSIRALEVTHGRNGFHPHLHVLLLVDKPLTNRQRSEAEDFITDRWQTMVDRYMGRDFMPDIDHAADLSEAHSAKYISKLGLELSDPGTKRGRDGHRTPMQILHDAVTHWTAADARIWRQYVEGIKGAQQLTWSRGLKARHGIIERTDEEIAEDEELPQTDRIVGAVPAVMWLACQRTPGADVWLLEQTEKGGSAGFADAIRYMRERLTAAS